MHRVEKWNERIEIEENAGAYSSLIQITMHYFATLLSYSIVKGFRICTNNDIDLSTTKNLKGNSIGKQGINLKNNIELILNVIKCFDKPILLIE